MPHACIGADVITGFPGEQEKDFLDTYNFIVELGLAYLHVFTYSERTNTTAVKLDDSVPDAIRNERTKMLRALSENKKRHFYEQHRGKPATVLFEQENKDGRISGYTENYIRATTSWDPALVNTIQKVQLLSMDRNGDMTIPSLMSYGIPAIS